MSLRLRLALTVVLAAIPLLGGMAWLQRELDRRAFEDGILQFVSWRMGPGGGLEACEESPDTWGGYMGGFGRPFAGRRGGPEGDRRRRWDRARRSMPRQPLPLPRPYIWAYDAEFASRNPAAPPFPDGLKASIYAGERISTVILPPREPPLERRREGVDDDEAREPRVPPERIACAVRMDSEEGPCAIVLVVGERRRQTRGLLSWVPIGIAMCMLLAVLFAAGPLVQRIRRLTEDVRHSADERYESRVTVHGNDEIADLARAFNDAGAEIRQKIDSLERREQALRTFISNTTHDVMIPLTVLQGHLAALRKRIDDGSEIDPQPLVAALSESQYIGSILQNLSAVAKLEGADLEIRQDPVELGDLVERAVARHRPIARVKEVALDYSVPAEPLLVAGDVTLLEQAVSNVVHNAVRYNKAGGHVAVLLEQIEHTRFSLRVIDDGPGIGEEELALLPERRFRGEDARTRHPDGLGLGLHITRDVAERHGFELTFRRSEYGGLEVELTGPTSAADQSGSLPDSPP